MRALQIAATGMSAQQTRVEVTSNNLANMSTTGYNARRAEFADLHYQQATRPGSVTAADGTVIPAGVQLGLGVRPTAVSVNLQQGPRRAATWTWPSKATAIWRSRCPRACRASRGTAG
jgi:flagellar basal-body rod protein FlgG